MKFQSLEAILAHEFVGNHAADYKAFEAIDAYIAQPEISDADAKRALDHVTVKGMGMDPNPMAEVVEHRAMLMGA